MNSFDSQKSNARIRVKMVESIPESDLDQPIVKKSTGFTSILTFDEGEKREVETSSLDTFVQIIEGSAEVIIEGISHFLKTGQVMILPAHHLNIIKAKVNLKLISTFII